MLRQGVYQHYKGQLYLVIGVAEHTETKERFVVYRALYGERNLWVRPFEMFAGDVTVGESTVPRFRYIGPEESGG